LKEPFEMTVTRIGFGAHFELAGPTAEMLANQIQYQAYLRDDLAVSLEKVRGSAPDQIVLRTEPGRAVKDSERQNICTLLVTSFEGTANKLVRAIEAHDNKVKQFKITIKQRLGKPLSRSERQEMRWVAQLQKNPQLWQEIQSSRHRVNRRQVLHDILMDHWKREGVFKAYDLN